MLRIPLFLAALSALSACVDDTTTEDIASARALWKSHEPARYSYTFRTICFCPPESVAVVATRDSVIEVRNYRPYQTGQVVDAHDYQRFSIDTVFANLEALRKSKPAKLRISYNPEFGFPDTVDYDQSESVADDEFSQMITDFHAEVEP